jgi:hypothetical protein
MLSEKHGYSVRINEPRLLPEEITRVGSFHRQKLKKAVITITVSEEYDINDEGCYRIRHLEEELFSAVRRGVACYLLRRDYRKFHLQSLAKVLRKRSGLIPICNVVAI